MSFLGKISDTVKTAATTVTDKVKSVAGVDDKSQQQQQQQQQVQKAECCSMSKCEIVHNEAKHEFTADVGDSNKAVLSYSILGATQPCASACLEEKTSAMSLSDKSCKQAELLNISVPESARHKGVGTALVVAFLNWANSPNQSICDVRLASATRDYIAKNADEIMKKSVGKYDMILSSRKV